MTDKQIIIDGIDVRDCCEWYSLPDGKLYCRINNKGDFTCKSNSDCQFKQLARAKQENKKLEKIINKSAERFCNDYLETFKENERLKSELQAKELELIMAKADLCRGCQYKNDYKAKEQECEALQMSENEAGEIIAELKAENDTLRQFLSKEPLALQALQSDYSSYKKSADVFYEMVKQYKQTLAEIKEIAETAVKCLYATKSDDYTDGYRWLGNIILQKISRCEI